jgi:hypothetical protein
MTVAILYATVSGNAEALAHLAGQRPGQATVALTAGEPAR